MKNEQQKQQKQQDSSLFSIFNLSNFFDKKSDISVNNKIKNKKTSLLDFVNDDDIVEDFDDIDVVDNNTLSAIDTITTHVDDFDEIIPATNNQLQEIVEPDLLSEIEEKNFIVASKIEEKKALLELRKRKALQKKNNIILAEEIPKQEIIAEQEIKTQYEELTGIELLPDTNLTNIVEEVVAATEDIPAIIDFNLLDFDIKEIPAKKDKSGYNKTLVSIKKSNFPQEMGRLATMIKKQSNNIVVHRVVDLRVIANTNKTQLRGSSLKLTATTILFKPKKGTLKVNKFTRFMISIPEDYKSTGNLLVYIQESRSKFICLIESSNFNNQQEFFDFIANLAVNYYNNGFDITKQELKHKNIVNPLLPVIKSVLATREYKANPKVDEETGIIKSVIFVSKVSEKNQWMGVIVKPDTLSGTYVVNCISKIDTEWRNAIVSKTNKPITISDLTGQKFIDILNTLYSRDWNHLDENSDNDAALYILINKLSYIKLKNAFIEIYDLITDENTLNPNNISIEKTLSKLDTEKIIPESYQAEGIIGKTDFIDYFVLTYLAISLSGKDKRNTRGYITTQEYHEKYLVKKGRKIEDRSKIIKNQNSDRNYNSRPFMFQLEYSINNVNYKYIDKEFENIKDVTRFLTNSPNKI